MFVLIADITAEQKIDLIQQTLFEIISQNKHPLQTSH